MPYSTEDDILEDFPSVTFDENSKVKLASIDNFIADADSVIDSYLAARYVVPVTGTKSLAVLKFYSRSLVSDKIKGLLEIKQQTNERANQNVRTGLSTKDIIKILEGYRDGTSILSDADLAEATVGGASFASGGVGGKTQRFNKDDDAW